MSSRKTEEYLEAIYNIVEKKGYAQIKDIAAEHGVSPPTVTEMMKKLRDRELVLYEKYNAITFTDKGRKIAEEVKKRHDIFEIFLKTVAEGSERPNDVSAMEEYLESVIEDYLEAVYIATEKNGRASIRDISSELEVSFPIVTEMMKKLRKRENFRDYDC